MDVLLAAGVAGGDWPHDGVFPECCSTETPDVSANGRLDATVFCCRTKTWEHRQSRWTLTLWWAVSASFLNSNQHLHETWSRYQQVVQSDFSLRRHFTEDRWFKGSCCVILPVANDAVKWFFLHKFMLQPLKIETSRNHSSLPASQEEKQHKKSVLEI